jgi:hypothetical protein
MPDAVGRSRVRDVYVGKTFGRLEDAVLDQDGNQVGASQTDKDRVREWIAEAIDQVQAEVQMDAVTDRSTTLTLESGISRYALDYDVLEIVRVVKSTGEAVRVMDMHEAQDRLTYGAGSWPDVAIATLVHEEMDASGRMIVRAYPAPESTATYTIWYRPKVAALDDRDRVIPLPSIFHPAVEAYCKAKLHERQEDEKMLQMQRTLYELAINKARARYRPVHGVQEAFGSSYQDRPTSFRAPGRMTHGN